MSLRAAGSTARNAGRSFGRRTGRSHDAAAPTDSAAVVGFAHIALGAITLGSAVLSVVFMPALSLVAVALPAITLLQAAALAFAGLWIRDGEQRGGILAACIHVLVLGIVFYVGGFTFPFGVIIRLALLAAVVWVLPELQSRRSHAPPVDQ